MYRGIHAEVTHVMSGEDIQLQKVHKGGIQTEVHI